MMNVPFSNWVLLALASLTVAACGPVDAPRKKGQKLQEMSCGGITTIKFYNQREFDKECIRILERERGL
jgi:hypothetical protein